MTAALVAAVLGCSGSESGDDPAVSTASAGPDSDSSSADMAGPIRSTPREDVPSARRDPLPRPTQGPYRGQLLPAIA